MVIARRSAYVKREVITQTCFGVGGGEGMFFPRGKGMGGEEGDINDGLWERGWGAEVEQLVESSIQYE